MLRRITTFGLGVLTGAALIYFAMNFHVIRAKDGFHMVPKINARLESTYADIRGYQVADWARHTDVAAALVNANRRDLLEGAVTDSFNSGLDQLLNRETR